MNGLYSCKIPIRPEVKDVDLGMMKRKRLTGEEEFHDAGKAMEFTVRDFWSWSTSDLLSNATRGILAEYIVGRALGAPLDVRDEWGAYDLKTCDGIRIEVKSAAYLQSWFQNDLSSRRSRSIVINTSIGNRRKTNASANRADSPMSMYSPSSRIWTKRPSTRSTFPSGSSTPYRLHGSTPAKGVSTRSLWHH